MATKTYPQATNLGIWARTRDRDEIVRADALRGFRELATELGGDGDALLRDAGLDPAALADGDAYVSYRRVVHVVERAAAQLHCPDFGLRMAQRTGASMLGPLSVAMYNAETVLDAFNTAQRFFHFHNPSVIVSLTRFDPDNDFIGLDVRMRRPPRHPQTFERGVATIHSFLIAVCGPAYKPREIASATLRSRRCRSTARSSASRPSSLCRTPASCCRAR
ncbi:MAG: AraC family transcriptional regulator ligand-binding domain-containing protein [Caulobacteraceae bacterium]